ncbi:MAG: hypothetical protein ACRYFR_13765 [Janthinobacterium lividum]
MKAVEQRLSYKLVADRLGAAINTVRAHIRTVYGELQINSKADLISCVRSD